MSLKIAEDHTLHWLSERSSLYCCSHSHFILLFYTGLLSTAFV